MILNYFNLTHILTLFVAAGLIAAVYFALRNRTVFAKEIAVLVLMGLNLTQHFFKFFLWPHMWGTDFDIVNTAYNVCAILIIASPVVYLSKSNLLKQFVAYVGTIGPAVTLLVPYWYIGSTILAWDYLRSWTCHTLLLATSSLPALWGLVKFNFRDGWKFGFVFLAMLALILLNDAVFMLVLGQATKETLYDTLVARNPLWTMGPSGPFESLGRIFEAFTPKIFLDPYVPILWYAIPMYLMVTIVAYALGGVLDRTPQSDSVPTLKKIK